MRALAEQNVTEVFGVGSVTAAPVIGEVRHVTVRRAGPLRRLQRHHADRDGHRHPHTVHRLSLREPAPQSCHPHGHGRPDPLPAQRRPRLADPAEVREARRFADVIAGLGGGDAAAQKVVRLAGAGAQDRALFIA
jgi:hypothetical protein